VLCPECQKGAAVPATRASRWFYTLNTEQHGPCTWRQLRNLAEGGQLSPQDTVMQEGSGYWVRAGALQALFARKIPASAPVEEPEAPSVEIAVPETSTSFVPAEETAVPEALTSITPAEEPSLMPPTTLSAPTPTPLSELPMPSMSAPVPRRSRRGKTIAWLSVGGSALLTAVVIFFGFSSFPQDGAPHAHNNGGGDEPQEESRSLAAIGAESPAMMDGAAAQIVRCLERLNRCRKSAGLEPLNLEDPLSLGCFAHAKYLARHVEPGAASTATVYAEDAHKPGYSLVGQRTAQTALVAYAEPLQAVNRWMARFFSRNQLLNPDIRGIGIGCAQNAQGIYVCVIDPVHGRVETDMVYPAPDGKNDATAEESAHERASGGNVPVLYPFPNQQDVPCIGYDRIDDRQTVGFPVSVIFPAQARIRDVTATLTDRKGNDVKILVSSPEHPLNPKLQRSAIGLHPLLPLQANQSYTVTVTAKVNDAAWQNQWQFTTHK
jgi:uncharacterized protein YkwD